MDNKLLEQAIELILEVRNSDFVFETESIILDKALGNIAQHIFNVEESANKMDIEND